MSDETDRSIRLHNALLIDGVAPRPVVDAVVDVDGAGTIRYAGPAHGAPPVEPHVRMIDARGGSVLPGFFDCHVHLGLASDKPVVQEVLLTDPVTRVLHTVERLRQLLHAGVTSARDLGGLPAAFRDAVASGLVEGPRLTVSVGIISHTGGHADTTMPSGFDLGMASCLLADSVDEARKAARLVLRDGADVVKICTSGGMGSAGDSPDDEDLLADEVAAVVDEARRHGNRPVAAHAQGTAGIHTAIRSGVRSIEHGYGIDEEGCDLLAECGAFLVPTLSTMFRPVDRSRMPEWHYQKKLRWQERTRENIAKAISRGVPIAMGTDAGSASHGENLTELAHLVELGMSPIDAIRSATITAARLLDVGDRLGSLQPGKQADLVVTAGNPLEDISLLSEPDNIVLVARSGRIHKNLLDRQPHTVPPLAR